jgi:hypothetical protein
MNSIDNEVIRNFIKNAEAVDLSQDEKSRKIELEKFAGRIVLTGDISKGWNMGCFGQNGGNFYSIENNGEKRFYSYSDIRNFFVRLQKI